MNLIYKIMNFLHTYISFIHVLNSFVCRKYRTDYTVLLMYSTVVSLPTPPGPILPRRYHPPLKELIRTTVLLNT